MCTVYDTFANDHVRINQYKYPYQLYKTEVRTHDTCIHEYAPEILEALTSALEAALPNIKLYNNQPYISPMVRMKLVDFLLKMSVRLKILPFVFYAAVRIFDRYCLKRIVLLDQAQLIITTCLWIAAKLNGGNNHFANLATDRKNNDIHSILDLGYGGGARFKGPTERYRLPKLNELVKLCGSRCNYDADMFRQMEMHILSALEWKLTDPSIDDFLVYSHEYKITEDDPLEAKLGEFFKMKEFIAYASCYSYELVGYTPLEVAKVVVDLINSTFSLRESDFRFQTLNQSILMDEAVVDYKNYSQIHNHLVLAIVRAPTYLLQLFHTRGPQLLHSLLAANYKPTLASCAGSMVLEPSSVSSSVFSDYHNSNYCYASPPPSVSSDSTSEFSIKGTEGFLPITRKPHGGVHFEPPHANNHHYPPFCPPYSRHNASLASLRSNSSVKEPEIFDDPGRCGLATPLSMDDEYKSGSDAVCKRRAY